MNPAPSQSDARPTGAGPATPGKEAVAAAAPAAAASLPETVVRIKAEVEQILGPGAVFAYEGTLPAFRVGAAEIHEASRKLRESGYDYLILLTATDYPEQKRIELAYVLSNFLDGREVCLVADVDREEPQIQTVSDLWEAADWHEREVYDLFGVKFLSHPDLRRILLDDTWEGYPLRKDYVDKGHDVLKRPY